MQLNDYQDKAAETAETSRKVIREFVESLGIPDRTKESHLIRLISRLYAVIGIVGEAGELANKFKKMMRDDGFNLTLDRAAEIKGEMGDVLWYESELCTLMNEEFNSVAVENINKIQSRKQRGTLNGSGDHR